MGPDSAVTLLITVGDNLNAWVPSSLSSITHGRPRSPAGLVRDSRRSHPPLGLDRHRCGYAMPCLVRGTLRTGRVG